MIYNLYFHPLSKYPGPKLWAATRLAFIRSLWKGDLTHDVQKIHDKFGPVVRTAPNELSFAKADAWNDIFQHRPGHSPFPKNPVWWANLPGQSTSILSAGPEDHARIRRLLNTSFTEKALRAQEPLIRTYVDLLMLKLKEQATALKTKEVGVVLDIVSWYNFTTFDIIGDLGLGQSFDCLKESALHPWVALIFNHFKVSSLLASVRHYPLASWLLMKCVPQKMRKMQKEHFQLAADRVDARMSLETERADFMTNVLKHNDEKGMSIGEIHTTFNILIAAGSETTATVLSGITNYLVRDSDVLQKLVDEVRSSFSKDEDVTLAALQRLTYLNATIEEGLRLCPPVPAGLPRLVPSGGDTVCGQWLPEHVCLISFPLRYCVRARTDIVLRPMYPSTNGPSPPPQATSPGRHLFVLSAG